MQWEKEIVHLSSCTPQEKEEIEMGPKRSHTHVCRCWNYPAGRGQFQAGKGNQKGREKKRSFFFAAEERNILTSVKEGEKGVMPWASFIHAREDTADTLCTLRREKEGRKRLIMHLRILPFIY